MSQILVHTSCYKNRELYEQPKTRHMKSSVETNVDFVYSNILQKL